MTLGRKDMPDLHNTLRAKLREVEALSAHIRQLDRDSEEQKEAIYRWAVIGDELTKLFFPCCSPAASLCACASCASWRSMAM